MAAFVSASRIAWYAGLATFIYQFENCMTATALPVMFREVAEVEHFIQARLPDLSPLPVSGAEQGFAG